MKSNINSCHLIIHCEAKKTVQFYLCNNFVKSFLYYSNNWETYTLIYHKHQPPLMGIFILVCEMQQTYYMSVLSRKLKSHHYHLEHLNETSYKVWKCMDQQRSAIVKHIIKCLSCLPLVLTYVPRLNRQWSIIWSMTVCCMDAWPMSFRRCLNSSTSRTNIGVAKGVQLVHLHFRSGAKKFQA